MCQSPGSKVEKGKEATAQNSSGGAMIPLHQVLQEGRIDGKMDALTTLIMFSRTTENACKLTPCSKIQFFSDANQINLVAEISASSGAALTNLKPLLLNYG